MGRSEFPTSTTAETSSSSWSTTNGERSALLVREMQLCLPPLWPAAISRATLSDGQFRNRGPVPVTIYDPTTADANGFGKTPYPNNTIPSVTPQSAALLKYLGTAATAPRTPAAPPVARRTTTTSTAPPHRRIARAWLSAETTTSPRGPSMPSGTARGRNRSLGQDCWGREARSSPIITSTWVPTHGLFRRTL